MSTPTTAATKRSAFQQNIYNTLKKELTDTIKKIANYESRRQLPVDAYEREQRTQEYKRELIGTYNCFVLYISKFYETFDLTSQFKTNEIVEKLKPKLRKCLSILNLQVNLPVNFGTIDTIEQIPLGAKNFESEHTHAQFNTPLDTESEDSNIINISLPHAQNIDTEKNNENTAGVSGVQINSTNNNLPTEQPIGTDNQDNTEPTGQTMPLAPGDISNGIPDFDPKSQETIKQFIAQVDLMYKLSPTTGDIILAVVQAKLVMANKLTSVDDKTWAQIKIEIQTKYRTHMSFEVAQEILPSVQQGPKESHDAYANRVRSLLDSLNGATLNETAAIQNSNREMNEALAIRKYKQNIFDRELRGIALSTDHTSLAEAISHATTKFEQLMASNINKKEHEKKEPEKKESESEKSNKNSNRQSNFKYNKNKQDYNSKNKNHSSQCIHCKKDNHQSEQCIFRPGGPGKSVYNKQEQAQTKSSNTAAAVAQSTSQNEAIATTSSVASQQAQTAILQPYHYLNC